jgi:hypothetical protein
MLPFTTRAARRHQKRLQCCGPFVSSERPADGRDRIETCLAPVPTPTLRASLWVESVSERELRSSDEGNAWRWRESKPLKLANICRIIRSLCMTLKRKTRDLRTPALFRCLQWFCARASRNDAS